MGAKVDEVACAVGVSEFHLSREFHRCTGINIAGTIADVRFERSKALLADGAMNVTQIAEAVGFGPVQAMIGMYGNGSARRPPPIVSISIMYEMQLKAAGRALQKFRARPPPFNFI